jgi:hypothetical protein
MSDCLHLTVTWDPQSLAFPDRLQTVHWFRCDWCPIRTCVVFTDVTLKTK